MKKIAIMAALAASVATASAADFSAFTKYDYDNLANASGVDLHRGTVGAKADFGKFGSVDAGVVGGRVNFAGTHASDQGVEVGYSNGVSFGKVGLSGRVGYARLNESSADVLRTSAEVSYPLTGAITAVAGVEHVRADGDALGNRFIAGADVAVTKKVTVRAVAARTNFTGLSANANGLTVAASYKF